MQKTILFNCFGIKILVLINFLRSAIKLKKLRIGYYQLTKTEIFSFSRNDNKFGHAYADLDHLYVIQLNKSHE